MNRTKTTHYIPALPGLYHLTFGHNEADTDRYFMKHRIIAWQLTHTIEEQINRPDFDCTEVKPVIIDGVEDDNHGHGYIIQWENGLITFNDFSEPMPEKDALKSIGNEVMRIQKAFYEREERIAKKKGTKP